DLTVTGLKLNTITASSLLTGVSGMSKVLKAIDTAANSIQTDRANAGASLKRLEFTTTNLNNQKINTDSSASQIADADMAKEMSDMTRSKILTESSMSMLSQANQTPQMVSKLLQ